MAQQSCREYKVRMARADKRCHVMRFKPPHKCDLEKLVNPTLDRQQRRTEEDVQPLTGEGSEYGRQRREEARKRKRGYAVRKEDPDDRPWVLKEQRKGGKHFVGRKEGSVNTSSSYYVFMVCEDGVFEAYPVNNWYDFVPPVKYDYLNADEAEKKFEERHKTLNYFSVMMSKKLREQEGEEGEGRGAGGEGEEGGSVAGVAGKKKVKKKEGVSKLYLTDSESENSDSSENEGDGSALQPNKGKKGKKQRKRQRGGDDGAGEETDEGDMEGQEVDYMTDSSSASEQEFQAKKAIKEVPKDDEEVERREEGEIDRGFTESSSSSEDELTEAGKEIKALIRRQTVQGSSSEEEEESLNTEENPPRSGLEPAAAAAAVPAAPKPSSSSKSPSKGKSESSKKDKKKSTTTATPQKRPLEQQEVGVASASGTPPSKKSKTESNSAITEEEVKRYLSRKPITSKELVKKFTSKKVDIDKSLVPGILSKIIKKMPNVEEQRIGGKLYLSLKSAEH